MSSLPALAETSVPCLTTLLTTFWRAARSSPALACGGERSCAETDVRRIDIEVGSILQRQQDVALLYVVDGEDERVEGEAFPTEWAADHDLSDAEVLIDDSGDVEGAIGRAAANRTLVIIGATGRGLLSRLLRGSLAYDVVDEVKCSVLRAERPSERSLRERFFGSKADADD